MDKTALIFGAGKTGRGFAAHLAYLGGYNIILVDKNRQLIADLNKASKYDIIILDRQEMNCTIPVAGAFHTEDLLLQEEFIATSLVFTSVFGNNLAALAKDLAMALRKRYAINPGQLLTIITCENLTMAAGVLKNAVVEQLGHDKEKWLSEYVGFCESIIFRTCLEPTSEQHPLTIRSQNFFELPCDGDALKEPLSVYGLKPLKQFSNQLRRKIYTYNCINAVITYLGAIKGYRQLHEAGNDAEILSTAKKAATETSAAQVAEFGFDSLEQEEWVKAAFLKFADTNIPDPIERNGADPTRKLARNDRLIGPALLALDHGIYPGGLIEGIKACCQYREPGNSSSIADIIASKGIGAVLEEICGLSKEEKLFLIIQDQYKEAINEKQ
jgi:mannitol-1-phosphate 5-dehydrogenase